VKKKNVRERKRAELEKGLNGVCKRGISFEAITNNNGGSNDIKNGI